MSQNDEHEQRLLHMQLYNVIYNYTAYAHANNK